MGHVISPRYVPVNSNFQLNKFKITETSVYGLAYSTFNSFIGKPVTFIFVYFPYFSWTQFHFLTLIYSTDKNNECFVSHLGFILSSPTNILKINSHSVWFPTVFIAIKWTCLVISLCTICAVMASYEYYCSIANKMCPKLITLVSKCWHEQSFNDETFATELRSVGSLVHEPLSLAQCLLCIYHTLFFFQR